jgi:hypothetical protein
MRVENARMNTAAQDDRTTRAQIKLFDQSATVTLPHGSSQERDQLAGPTR